MARLLVVDDDPDIRAMFVRTLRSLGEVEEADGGTQAMRLLYAREFDLLLLDLHMPVIDGFAILESLASKPGPNQDTPVFVVTADISDNTRIQALRRHALFLLTKPVNLATLLSFASSSLQKRMSRGPVTPRGGRRD